MPRHAVDQGAALAVLGRGNSFRDVREWYSRIILLERQVCLLETNEEKPRPIGTAFLVGPDLLLTAHHNLSHWRGPQTAGPVPLNLRPPPIRARFGFAVSTRSGDVLEGERFAVAAQDWLLAAPAVGYYLNGADRVEAADGTGSEDLALVRLTDKVGLMKPEGTDNVRGWVDLRQANANPEVGSSLAIFQHANGGPLKVSVNTESIIGFNDDRSRLFYRTDTLPGSSGGPCFDADWKFLALHQGTSVRDRNYNMGVPYTFIENWLARYGFQSLVAEAPPESQEVTISRRGFSDTNLFPFDPDLRRLMQRGEGQQIEFKECAIERSKDGQPKADAKLADRLVKSVAAFMNSDRGGNVLVGITDDMKFLGVESEYEVANKQRKDWNGYELWLSNALRGKVGKNATEEFSIERYREEGKDICVIRIRPTRAPVWVEGKLYVRKGPENIPRFEDDLFQYIRMRWPTVERSSDVSLE